MGQLIGTTAGKVGRSLNYKESFMAEPSSKADVIAGSIVLVFITVVMFKACSGKEPDSKSGISSDSTTMHRVDDLVEVLKNSDDYSNNSKAFLDAAQSLIADKSCTFDDFKEMGGWVKSTNYPNESVYFTYCGGLKSHNKIHLDTSDGRIFYGSN